MKFKSLLVLSIFIALSCSKNDDHQLPDSNSGDFISSYYLTYEPGIDSLFYENKKIKMVKEYVGGASGSKLNLDYVTTFRYNEQNQLIEVSKKHSKASEPNTVIKYTYNTDGSLHMRTKISATYQAITKYSYDDSSIILNANESSEIRIHLNSKNQITHVEEYGGTEVGFYTFKEYDYNDNNSISHVIFRDRDGTELQKYSFTYDENPNPFRAFDFPLPNNLSIKTLNDAEGYDNYTDLPDNFSIDDNEWGYFSKNNMTSCIFENNAEYIYNYEYDERDRPINVLYEFRTNTSLIITYYDDL